MKRLYALILLLFFCQPLAAGNKLEVVKVKFKTKRQFGTIQVIRHGKPITIGAISGYIFTVLATDLPTGQTRSFNGEVDISTRTTVPTWANITGIINSYAGQNKFKQRANNYFNQSQTEPEIVDSEGIVVPEGREINPDE